MYMPDRKRTFGIAARASLVTAAAIILSPQFAPRAQAAQSGRGARRIETETPQRSLREFERPLYKPPPRPRRLRPSYQEVAEDFKQLQLSNYNLSQAAGRGEQLNYDRIRAEAAEVKKRASRLKASLLLPETNDDHDSDVGAETASPEGLTSSSASLDALVNSFVWNPVFQRPGVIDLELSAKASRDLEQIIRLSERIRRGAADLCKGAGKK